MTARIDKSKLETPEIFKVLAETGSIPERDMFNTYNMGIGMTVVVSREDSDRALEIIRGAGDKAYVIGEIVKGDEGVIIDGIEG